MPGSHSRAFIVRLFEQTVSSTRDASSDIALPPNDSHLSASVRRGALAKGCAHARLVLPLQTLIHLTERLEKNRIVKLQHLPLLQGR